MKTSIIGSLALVVACLVLSGCGEDKRIAEVKALPFSYPSENVADPNMTVDQALDYRKVCESMKWKVDQTEQHQTFVEYTCSYKGVKNSAFIATKMAGHPNGNAADSTGDVYQWTYGADDKPRLSYVAMQVHYADGKAKDLTQSESVHGMYVNGALWMTTLMKVAVENTAEDYDHFYHELYGTRIPPMPEAPLPIQETASASQVATQAPANDSVAESTGGSLDACEQSWTDAFRKESGQDAMIAYDQIEEWDGWCKRGYDASKGMPPDA